MTVFKCPKQGCDKEYKTLARFENHWREKHNEPLTAQVAVAVNALICPKCAGHLTTRNADGSIPRSSRCSVQSQPITQQSIAGFAEQTQQLHQQQQDELIANFNDDSQGRSLPIAARKQRMREIMREYAIASTQKDYARTEILARDFIDTAERIPSRKRQTQVDTSQDPLRPIRKAVRILQTTGKVGKAMAALRETGLFDINPHTQHVIHELFVPRFEDFDYPDDIFTDERYDSKIESKTIREVLLNKDKGTARGPSGMGYAELIELVKEDVFLDDLTLLVNDLANFRFPMNSPLAERLRVIRLVALQKKEPNAARPLGISEVLTNLVSSAQMRQERSENQRVLSPHDYGLCSADATATPAVLIQERINAARNTEEQGIFIKADLENCYGRLSRAHILKILLVKRPALVRWYVALHELPTRVESQYMDSFLAYEGLIQGNAASPAYCQIIISDICSKVRNASPNVTIGSYFDDCWVESTDFDAAIEAFLKLEDEVQKVNGRVRRDKSLLFATEPLDRDQRREANKCQLSVNYDGFKMVGTPVGCEHYVRTALRDKAAKTISILDKISECITVGKVNQAWATPQGLYILLRDSANQLLRHLLRTVDPRLVRDEFTQVDTRTREIVYRLFDITPGQRSDIIATRIGLPGSLGGLGLASYADVADAAYVGCVGKIGRSILAACPEARPELIPGLHQARETLASMLNSEEEFPVPTLRELFHPDERPGADEPNAAKPESLQRRLTRKIHERKLRLLMGLNLSVPERSLIQTINNPTAADFLFVRYHLRRNHIPAKDFVLAVRQYMGLPITAPTCTADRCQNFPVVPYGQHIFHVRAALTRMHTLVNDEIYRFFMTNRDGGQPGTRYRVTKEGHMSLLQYPLRQGGDPQKFDIALEHEITGHAIVLDTTITTPMLHLPMERFAAVERAYKAKVDKYTKNYDISPDDIIPLAFESSGGYHPSTMSFFKLFTLKIAGNNPRKADELMRTLRERVAIAIRKGFARAIRTLNAKQATVQVAQIAAQEAQIVAQEQAPAHADDLEEMDEKGSVISERDSEPGDVDAEVTPEQ